MRRSLRELYEKLSKNREKYAAGGDSEDIASINVSFKIDPSGGGSGWYGVIMVFVKLATQLD